MRLPPQPRKTGWPISGLGWVVPGILPVFAPDTRAAGHELLCREFIAVKVPRMLAGISFAFAAALAAVGQAHWFDPFPAHRVIGNVYYVGSKDLASYLITTPEGHIVINSGFERTVPLIRSSVESLGFKMADIKILLTSHAHSDHVAGHALLQELTGAKVYVMRGDDGVIASGGEGQYLYSVSRWKPCKVDRVLEDGDRSSSAASH